MAVEYPENCGSGDSMKVDAAATDSNIADFQSNSASKMVIKGNGKVGIGTDSPGGILEVVGRGRFTCDDSAVYTSGKGLEVAYREDADCAYFLSYDRDSSSHKDMKFYAAER